jgi:hypothetical protein
MWRKELPLDEVQTMISILRTVQFNGHLIEHVTVVEVLGGSSTEGQTILDMGPVGYWIQGECLVQEKLGRWYSVTIEDNSGIDLIMRTPN